MLFVMSASRISRRRCDDGWKRPDGECVFSCAERRAVYADGRERLDEPGVAKGLRLLLSGRAEPGLLGGCFFSPLPPGERADDMPPCRSVAPRILEDLVGWVSRFCAGRAGGGGARLACEAPSEARAAARAAAGGRPGARWAG